MAAMQRDSEQWDREGAAARAGARVALLRRRLHRRLPLLASVLALLAVLGAYGRLSPAWLLAILAATLAGIFFLPPPASFDETADTSLDAARRRRMRAGAPAAYWPGIVDALPDGACVLDASGRVLHHNRAAADIFPQVEAGRPFSQVSRYPDLLQAIDRACTPGEPFEGAAAVHLVERVPSERHMQVRVARLFPGAASEPGEPAVLLVSSDTTEQDRQAAMRADFIANASHELRTPLASLRGFIETLQGPARDDARARERFLGIMAAQAERMTRLIDDLLSLSRVEMRAHLPPKGRVDLNEVATHVGQALEPLAREAGIAVTVGRLEGAAMIVGERDEIVQVAQNLLQNALKYGRPGGNARIEVVREPQADAERTRLALVVTDDGPGIAPEHLPRLTERFYRVSTAASREKGGTGLGLAIVKHIANRHHALLEVTSVVGRGSVFRVVFAEHKKSK